MKLLKSESENSQSAKISRISIPWKTRFFKTVFFKNRIVIPSLYCLLVSVSTRVLPLQCPYPLVSVSASVCSHYCLCLVSIRVH